MYNSGLELSKIDGSEFQYEIEDKGIPFQFSYMKQLPSVLNQGEKPICVPCSLSAYFEYKISLKTGKKQNSKFKLYDIFESRTTDGEGMTFKDAFKHIINNGAKYKDGIIKASKYFMITNILQLRHAIYANGPCLVVLPVYNENLEEFWQKSGKCKGYHAVAVVGYDENGFILRNSWGPSYGHNGYSYITNKDINSAKEIWTLI